MRTKLFLLDLALAFGSSRLGLAMGSGPHPHILIGIPPVPDSSAQGSWFSEVGGTSLALLLVLLLPVPFGCFRSPHVERPG